MPPAHVRAPMLFYSPPGVYTPVYPISPAHVRVYQYRGHPRLIC